MCWEGRGALARDGGRGGVEEPGAMSNGTLLELGGDDGVDSMLHLEDEVPWYRQLELIVTTVIVVVLIAGVVWHLATLSEWAEESLQYVEMAAMESAQYAQGQAQRKSTSEPRRTSSRVVGGAKAVAVAGKDTVLFAPRALVSAGISLKYRLHNAIDDVVQTATSLSPKWRGIWFFGDVIILVLALTILMIIPGSFLVLFVAWTALIVRCDGGDTHAMAIDIITDMVASADMVGVSHIGPSGSKDSAQPRMFANPLLNSKDLEGGESLAASESGGKLLMADEKLFVGQKREKVTRDEARALHTMLLIQQERYAKQEEAEERRRKAEERRQTARKLFEETDTDGNGTLDVEELHELAKTMGVGLTFAQAEKAFADIDEDGSGEIDFEEFLQFYEANVCEQGGLKAGFGSFFSGFKQRLQTVGLHPSKPLSRGITSDSDLASNKKLSSLKNHKQNPLMLSSTDALPSNDSKASSGVRPIDNVSYSRIRTHDLL